MADPVTLAVIGIGASAAGAGVGAMGQLYQGKAQANLANYQAQIASINSKIAQQDANYAIASGEVEAQQTGLRYRAEVGQTKAAFAAGNLDITSGSPNKVIASEAALGAQAQGIVRANAAKRAYGYEVEAMQDTAQSQIYRSAAATAPTAAALGATASILGGIGTASDQYIRGRSSGIFSV